MKNEVSDFETFLKEIDSKLFNDLKNIDIDIF